MAAAPVASRVYSVGAVRSRRHGRHGRRRSPSIALALGLAGLVAAGCSVSADVQSLKADAVGSPRDGDDHPDVSPDDGEDGPGTGADADADDSATGSGTLDWSRCGGRNILTFGFQCATLEVPLDYGDPDGEQIEIALTRVRATGNDRIGSLLFNPGGPGGSGIDFLTAAASRVPPELAARFDLVSFDPRGVGASSAIECDVDLDDTPALAAGDDAAWVALVSDAERQAEQCTEASNALARFVGTNSAARDLDEIREALGDDQLSYVGFSYGTRLGAVYAELFPDRVRALVLDGAVKPTSDLAELSAGQGPAFDNAFERFAATCDADADCPLTAPATDVYTTLRQRLGDDATIPVADPARALTLGELELSVAAGMYSTQTWPIVAQGLDEADAGDASILQALADAYLGRRPDGSYDATQAAGSAINCADDPNRPPPDEVRRRADAVAASSIWFDGFLRASTGCIGAAEAIDPVTYGPASGAAPMLVIGTTNDPATPYEWAIELADLLESAVLYRVDGDGHTAFLSSPCVDDVVVRYLVDLELPGDGASCADDAETDPFPPPGESEFDRVLALFDCLREHGVDIPDMTIGDLVADPSGESLLDVLDPTDPDFVRAAFSCQDLLADL